MAITKIGTTGILNNLDVPGYLYLSGDNKELRFYNGANYMVLKASGSLSNNYTITLPVDDGTSGQFLKTDGGGVTSWDTVTSSDTTYSTTWVDSSANAILRLTAGGSGSGTDDLTIVAGTNITLTPSGDNLTIDAAAGGIASVVADTTPQLGGNLDMVANLLVGNGGSTGIAISANGEVTMAAQPAVFAEATANDANETGAGAAHTVLFDGELFDQNGDWNTSNTFKAPITGRYYVSSQVWISGITTATTSMFLKAVASNRTIILAHFNTDSTNCPFVSYVLQGGTYIDMHLNDELIITVTSSGESSDVHDIGSSASGVSTTVGISLEA